MGRLALVVITTLAASLYTRSQQQDTTAVDSALVKQIEQQMQSQQAQPLSQQTPQQGQQRSGISTNPNISAIGDFQSAYHSLGSRNFDAYFNEAEVSFQSFVDPYARADFFFSLSKSQSTGVYEPDIEEAYLTTLDLPANLQLKAGKFRMALGRLNPVHPHAYPFVDLPNAFANYFGDGLADEGFSLSWLVPNPLDFYQEVTFEVTNGPTGIPSFTRSDANRYLYLGHIKNFWDLTENATLEFGLTGITGPNDSGFTTTIGAFDLTYKWKPLQYNTYQSVVWQTEAFFSRAKYRNQPLFSFSSRWDSSSITTDVTLRNDIIETWGMYSFLTYQLEKRWFLTGRFDYSNLPFSSGVVERAYSATLGWYATEFQKIELEGKLTSSNYQDNYYQALLRWIFVIGTHGAHQY